jgi:quinol monooxygenase YgiN
MKTYVATYIEVQPNYVTEAIALIRDYSSFASGESGCVSIEPLQEVWRRHRFVVIEEWNDDASFQAHENSPNTAQFRSKLREIHKSPPDQRLHHEFEIGPRGGTATSFSFYVVTHVDVPPPRKDETEALLRGVAEEMRSQEGNLQFDIFQQKAPRTNHFTVLAIWTGENAFASHEANLQTRRFRESLGPMLGAPYDERVYLQFFTHSR